MDEFRQKYEDGSNPPPAFSFFNDRLNVAYRPPPLIRVVAEWKSIKQRRAVPSLALGMTGHWEGLAAEKIYDHAKSADKSRAFIEGADHIYRTCTKCETTPASSATLSRRPTTMSMAG